MCVFLSLSVNSFFYKRLIILSLVFLVSFSIQHLCLYLSGMSDCLLSWVLLTVFTPAVTFPLFDLTLALFLALLLSLSHFSLSLFYSSLSLPLFCLSCLSLFTLSLFFFVYLSLSTTLPLPGTSRMWAICIEGDTANHSHRSGLTGVAGEQPAQQCVSILSNAHHTMTLSGHARSISLHQPRPFPLRPHNHEAATCVGLPVNSLRFGQCPRSIHCNRQMIVVSHFLFPPLKRFFFGYSRHCL